MSTTGMVMTVTDELLAELEAKTEKFVGFGIRSDTVARLVTELRRLRAENAELEQSLAESRANDQAAMGWLTSLRWASGDRGERMLPELVTHIEELAKDAGRYRWLRDEALNIDGWAPAVVITEGSMIQQFLEGLDLDDEIDTAMATQ